MILRTGFLQSNEFIQTNIFAYLICCFLFFINIWKSWIFLPFKYAIVSFSEMQKTYFYPRTYRHLENIKFMHI